MQKLSISETALQTDLKELAGNLTRELAVACKKVAIYGPHHPQAGKAIEKPFFILGRILTHKRFVNYRLQNGQLSLLNIGLTETIFNTHLIQFMQACDLSALVFERGLTASDFSRFIERFATVLQSSDNIEGLHNYLRSRGINKIQCNSEFGHEFFENQKRYRGDVHGDFSLRKFCSDQLPSKLDDLIEVASMDEAGLEKLYIDFSPEVVQYLLPEKIGSLSIDSIRSELAVHATDVRNAANDIERKEKIHHLIKMIGLLECHADHARFIQQFDPELKDQFRQFEELGDPGSATGKIRMELRQKMDLLLSNHFGSSQKDLPAIEIAEALLRLTKTGQHQHAEEVIGFLQERLADPDSHYRQHSLEVLIDIVNRLDFPGHYRLTRYLVESLSTRIAEKQETFEYSELIGQLYRRCLDARHYKLIVTFTRALSSRKNMIDGVTVYDSLAVKKGLDNINFENGIRILVDDLLEGAFEAGNDIRQILMHIGSEEVAVALSEIITHPKRQVRQQALRILAELGKSALTVFSRILMDDSFFERETGRHELPDSQWYVVRNSIFVLGSLKDEAGLPALRLRMSDKDVRIRREIVDSLEKIAGDEAVDLLILMAEDSVREIAEKALRTVGLIGQPESVPLLIDLAERQPMMAGIAIWAIGKVGGEYAYNYLSDLLGDTDHITRLAAGRMSREEIRLAVVKALGLTGDTRVVDAVKGFQDGLSTTQKLFFKSSPIQKAITEILDKK